MLELKNGLPEIRLNSAKHEASVVFVISRLQTTTSHERSIALRRYIGDQHLVDIHHRARSHSQAPSVWSPGRASSQRGYPLDAELYQGSQQIHRGITKSVCSSLYDHVIDHYCTPWQVEKKHVSLLPTRKVEDTCGRVAFWLYRLLTDSANHAEMKSPGKL